jgi:hypothetical protein
MKNKQTDIRLLKYNATTLRNKHVCQCSEQPVPKFFPEPLGRLVTRRFLFMDFIQFPAASDKINLIEADPLGALDDLPVEVKYQEDRDADVGGEENGYIPVSSEEYGEPVEEQNKEHKDSAEPRCVWLERSFVWELVAGETLLLEAVVHPQVGHEDDKPGNKTGDRRDVVQPVKNFTCG